MPNWRRTAGSCLRILASAMPVASMRIRSCSASAAAIRASAHASQSLARRWLSAAVDRSRSRARLASSASASRLHFSTLSSSGGNSRREAAGFRVATGPDGVATMGRGRSSARGKSVLCSCRTCPFRKSYPDVLVVQSGQDWDGDNDTGPLDRPTQWRILAQRQMRARRRGRDA